MRRVIEPLLRGDDEGEFAASNLDRCGSRVGHLVIFDEKVYRRDESFGGRPIVVWGM